MVDLVRQRRDLADRDISGHFLDCLAHLLRDLSGISREPDFEIREVRDVLRVREIRRWMRPLPKRLVLCVLHDSNDLVVAAVSRVIAKTEMAADRGFCWEEPARHGFIDHGNLWRPLVVLRSEGAAGKYR